jgi:hypothetical protein
MEFIVVLYFISFTLASWPVKVGCTGTGSLIVVPKPVAGRIHHPNRHVMTVSAFASQKIVDKLVE